MRILMVTSYPLAGQYDGTAMLSKQILWGLQKRGLVVAHAYMNLRQPFRGIERVDFEGTPSYRLPAHAWVRGLRQIHREHPFDLVHAEHYGGRPARISPASAIAGRWSTTSIRCWGTRSSALASVVDRSSGLTSRSRSRVCATAAAVVVLGEQNKQVMVEEKGVPADRVSVIHPGLDLAPIALRGHPPLSPASGPTIK